MSAPSGSNLGQYMVGLNFRGFGGWLLETQKECWARVPDDLSSRCACPLNQPWAACFSAAISSVILWAGQSTNETAQLGWDLNPVKT